MTQSTEELDLSSMKGLKSPRRDLWPEIEKRLENKKNTQKRSTTVLHFARPVAAFTAIAAALIIGINIGSTDYIKTVNNEYKQTETLIMFNLADSDISPEIVEKVKKNLDAIDQSVDQIILLIRQDPNNPDLKARLYQINEKRFEFLESIRALIQEDSSTENESFI